MKTFIINYKPAGVNSYYTAKSDCGTIVYTRKSLSSLTNFVKSKGYNIRTVYR